MKECLRLSQDGEMQSIKRMMHKVPKSGEDTSGQSETEEQLHTDERTTRSFTRLRSRNFPEPTTLSDVESDDSEVDMGKLKKGRRALGSPSDAA